MLVKKKKDTLQPLKRQQLKNFEKKKIVKTCDELVLVPEVSGKRMPHLNA